jgi:hypothetical protein
MYRVTFEGRILNSISIDVCLDQLGPGSDFVLIQTSQGQRLCPFPAAVRIITGSHPDRDDDLT